MDRKYKKANFGHYLWIFHFLDLQIPHMETNRMALPFRYHFVPIPESETTFVEVSNHLPPFCHFVKISTLCKTRHTSHSDYRWIFVSEGAEFSDAPAAGFPPFPRQIKHLARQRDKSRDERICPLLVNVKTAKLIVKRP